eukprot:jgi/Botrbrau1/8913/Bobra.0148s0027.1
MHASWQTTVTYVRRSVGCRASRVIGSNGVELSVQPRMVPTKFRVCSSKYPPSGPYIRYILAHPDRYSCNIFMAHTVRDRGCSLLYGDRRTQEAIARQPSNLVLEP